MDEADFVVEATYDRLATYDGFAEHRPWRHWIKHERDKMVRQGATWFEGSHDVSSDTVTLRGWKARPTTTPLAETFAGKQSRDVLWLDEELKI